SFTAVVNRYPRYQEVGSVDSVDRPFAGPWVEVPVPEPGRYMVVVRYYRWGDEVELPAVEVDGVPVCEPLRVPSDVNRFYEDLPARRNLYYVGLHFYVYAMLTYADRLPARIVEREYLPIANPRTVFRYGAVDAGER